MVQGEVNDENASAMGGVAGMRDCLAMRSPWRALPSACCAEGSHLPAGDGSAVYGAAERAGGKFEGAGVGYAFEPSQSGARFSEHSFGHLGYTGTSLWCDAERGISVTLLTNRSWPDGRNQAIKEVRPAVHDAIVSALEN